MISVKNFYIYNIIMFDYIFTIGCFDKLHKGHIKLLESSGYGSRESYCGLYHFYWER